MNHYFCIIMRYYILVFVLLSLYGCKKEDNPISNSNIDDGSYDYTNLIGCMDENASNYNPNTTIACDSINPSNDCCEYQYFVKLNFKLFDGTKELSRYANFTNNNVNFSLDHFSNVIVHAQF